MSDELNELSVKAELTLSDEVLETVEKKFFFLGTEEAEAEVEPKTLDETIADFLQEIETKAKEKGLEIENRDEFYTKSVTALILFFIKGKDRLATLNVPVQRAKQEPEVEENGEPAENE
jgi:hypothetical protein